MAGRYPVVFSTDDSACIGYARALDPRSEKPAPGVPLPRYGVVVLDVTFVCEMLSY